MSKTFALVVNSGEMSINYTIFEAKPDGDVEEVGTGYIDQIGTDECAAKLECGGNVQKASIRLNDHAQAMEHLAHMLTDAKGPISDISDIKVVGHRVVHGGKDVSEPLLIDDAAEALIEKCIPLAPAQNPASLIGIRQAKEQFPCPQVGVFDTAFNATMPPESYRYAIPNEVYEKYDVRRYGFHGISYKYVSGVSAVMNGTALEDSNMIICHIAKSCSMACLQKGKVIDTTMGMTPLEGLMQGARCGDIDAGVYGFLCEHVGMSPKDIDTMMNEDSGLKGICGKGDMREVVGQEGLGNTDAKLARKMFVDRVRKYLGAFYVKLNCSVDTLVFTGQIGEHDKALRELITSNLQGIGIEVDSAANQGLVGCGEIQSSQSKVKVHVVPSQEELSIAQAALEKANLRAAVLPKSPARRQMKRLGTGRRFSLTPDMVPKLLPTKNSTLMAMGGMLLVWALVAGVSAMFLQNMAGDLAKK